ncbi:hypothetical protein SAMN05216428_11558 [Nitrosospira sp. Nsp11]|uniref:hypothetical protein n=1 Tax=Nitrosospira sp. Nsp11 TaxID=1855338 RepID=UPI0009128D92|nr:hypothetical protein [Nitrosospira sp. Nsp11]SHM15109.1 hypothetical protein SAMN05216428_11558 [Nitrosospira sp. Nsp11]
MSLFWNISFPTLLEDTMPVGAPLAALGHLQSYASIFNSLIVEPEKAVEPSVSGAPLLELPWPRKGTHWFWSRYLRANPIRKISGSYAFVRLLPFRRHGSPASGLGVALSDGVTPEHVLSEAWFHPHMVTFAVHFTVSGEFTLEKMSDLCLELRQGRVLTELGDGALYKLDEVAAKHLEALLLEGVGENTGPPTPVTPFSLVTVLNGDGGVDQAIVEGELIHRTLEAVTQWDRWRMGALDGGRISSRLSTSAAPLLFGHARSRVVWDPYRFSTNGSVSLSCYHRNLFVGTMQTEALLSFARVAEEEEKAGRRPRAIRDCEDAVLKHIIALHKGEDTTYRSASLRRFIDDHAFRRSVDNLAQRIKGEELPALPVQLVPGSPNPPAIS